MHNPSQRPDQKAIAGLLGISQATVSRALRNDHRIAKTTRDRVWSTAREAGYRPNLLMASRSSKTHSGSLEHQGCPIAVLFHPGPHTLRAREAFTHFQRHAEGRGFVVERFEIDDQTNIQRLQRQLYTRGFQGIYILLAEGERQWFGSFDFSPFVTISSSPLFEREPILTIRPLQRRTASEAVAMAFERGYHRAGAILWKPGTFHDDSARAAGFITGQMEQSGRFDPASLFAVEHPGRRSTNSDRSLRTWLRKFRPEMIICSSQAEMHWLRALQFDLPGLILFGANAKKAPYFSGFSTNWDSIASLAVQMFEQGIRLRHYGLRDEPILLTTPARWVEGCTLPPAHLASRTGSTTAAPGRRQTG